MWGWEGGSIGGPFPVIPNPPGQVQVVQTLRQRAPSCIVSWVSVQTRASGGWVPEYPGVQSHFGEWYLRVKRGEARTQDRASGLSQ